VVLLELLLLHRKRVDEKVLIQRKADCLFSIDRKKMKLGGVLKKKEKKG